MILACQLQYMSHHAGHMTYVWLVQGGCMDFTQLLAPHLHAASAQVHTCRLRLSQDLLKVQCQRWLRFSHPAVILTFV